MYLWYGISGGTRASYEAIVREFGRFCWSRGWSSPFIPAEVGRVEAWIAEEADKASRKGLGKKTLKRKLSALISWHVDLGIPAGHLASQRMERIVAGANAYHGVVVRPQPLPITLPILRKILQAIRLNQATYGGPIVAKGLIAAFTLAFGCFLRMGELTYDTFDPRFDLRVSSIKEDGGEMRLTIPASKTDPFRQGVTVVIPEGPRDICPRTAIRDWIRSSTNGHDGPLFHINGQPFKRNFVIKHLARALDDTGYVSRLFSGHSFRRGAATWAASVGMTGLEIKTLGRWNSECYRLYVDAGPQRSADLGRSMLSATSSSLPLSGLPKPGDVWRPTI